ncbi:MAG: hypothetical protein ABIH20_04900 [Candidatus Diapherotrites archaeon]
MFLLEKKTPIIKGLQQRITVIDRQLSFGKDENLVKEKELLGTLLGKLGVKVKKEHKSSKPETPDEHLKFFANADREIVTKRKIIQQIVTQKEALGKVQELSGQLRDLTKRKSELLKAIQEIPESKFSPESKKRILDRTIQRTRELRIEIDSLKRNERLNKSAITELEAEWREINELYYHLFPHKRPKST